MAIYAKLYDTTGNGIGDTLVLDNNIEFSYTGTLINNFNNEDCTANPKWQNINYDGYETVDILNTIQPSNCSWWFAENKKLKTIKNITNIDTSSVIDTSWMFYNCQNLTTLDLTSFKTNHVVSMIGMFQNCSNLTTIYATQNFITDYIEHTSLTEKADKDMFLGCVKLVGENGTTYNENYVDSTYATIDTEETPGYFTTKVTQTNTVTPKLRTVSLRTAGVTKTYTNDFAGQYERVKDNIDNVYSTLNNMGATMPTTNNSNNLVSTIETIPITNEYWADVVVSNRPNSWSYAFAGGYSNINTIDTTNWNSSNITTMGYMFYYNSSLKTINLNNLDTSNVTNIHSMFYYCYNLTTLDVSNWNTSKINVLGSTFMGCSNLTTLNINTWTLSSTNKITSLQQMFSQCINLVSLDISNFIMNNVYDLSYTFYFCRSLTNLNIQGWNLFNIKNLYSTFNGCNSLTYINGINTWNYCGINNMICTFNNCTNLSTLNFNCSLTNNFYSVINCQNTFADCWNIDNINLSQGNFYNLTQANNMFRNCYNLVNLNVDGWNTLNLKNISFMFANCNNLSEASYASITNMLPNASQLQTTQRNLYNIGFTNLEKFNKEQLQILNIKGYLDAIVPQPNLLEIRMTNATEVS